MPSLAGMSQSVFLASSYIMAATSLTADEAIRYVETSKTEGFIHPPLDSPNESIMLIGAISISRVLRSSRKIASPNMGFLRQLTEFQVFGLEEERRRLSNKFFNSRLEKRGWT